MTERNEWQVLLVIKTASISILFTEANFGPGLPSGSKGNINIEVGSPNQLNKKKKNEKREWHTC